MCASPTGAAALAERRLRSQRGFFRALGSGAEGSRVVDPAPGVQATVVPVRPWFSIFNAVVYEDAGAVRGALPRLAEAYGSAGVRGWSVWVPPGDEETARLLEREGFQQEGTPLAMAAELGGLDLAAPDELDLVDAPTWTQVAALNDRAHGVLSEWSMTAAFEAMDDPASRLYAARVDGELAATLLCRRSDGDAYFWFVATAPELQGRGLGAALMRRALADARDEGCSTATLESTAAGERLYRTLGFAELGRCARWARYER